jgi:CBS domain-containing protein
MMTTSVFAVKAEHSLEGVMALMTNKRIRHLPVVDNKERLIGVISIGDVLKAVIRQQQAAIGQLQGMPTLSIYDLG